MIKKVDLILKKYRYNKFSIIQVLGEVQQEFNYLPKDILVYVGNQLKIPLSKIFSIASFYANFSLKPRGKHLISVCLGTACHVQGGPRIAETISEQLGIRSGETTSDQEFSFETVNCLGACALGPIVVEDGKYHGQMNIGKTQVLMKRLLGEEIPEGS